MKIKLLAISILLSLTSPLFSQEAKHLFRIRTITAGVTLNSLTDTTTLNSAIEFLKKAEQEYILKGYEVQSLRISTQNLYNYLDQYTYENALPLLDILERLQIDVFFGKSPIYTKV